MAKRVHTVKGKGILHDDFILEVLGKKEDEPSEFYSLLQILEEFKGKTITFSFADESPIEQVEE